MMPLGKLVIEISKVGALTSKVYTFQGRKWELETIESCDIFNPLVSSIKIEISGIRVIRILPQVSEDMNEEWLDNRSRYCFDGLIKRRIGMPFVRISRDCYLGVSWLGGMEILLPWLENNMYNVSYTMGEAVDSEAIATGVIIGYLSGPRMKSRSCDWQSEYCVSKKEQLNSVDLIVVLNINLRREFPLLEYNLKRSRILGSWCEDKHAVRSIGFSNTSKNYIDFLNGNSVVCRLVKRLGSVGLILRADRVLLTLLESLKDLGVWKYTLGVDRGNKALFELSRSTCIDNLGLLYEVQQESQDIGEMDYYVSQVSIAQRSVRRCDQVFPVVSFMESEGLYLNMFGYTQSTRFIFSPGKDVRADWKILSFIQRIVFVCLTSIDLSDFSSVRRRVYDLSPSIFRRNYNLELVVLIKQYFFEDLLVSNVVVNEYVRSYYSMNFLSRASKILDLAGRKDNIYFYGK